MGSVLFTAELVIGSCLLVVVLFLAVTYWRRRLILRSGEVADCAFRDDASSRWHSGLLRLGTDTLDWFPLFGLTPRPHSRWVRTTLQLGIGQPLDSSDPLVPLLRDALRIPVTALEQRRGPVTVELALPSNQYTAMRAWVEAAPPGTRPMTN